MRGRGAVWLVVWVFTVVMLGGTVPAPLYPFYVRSLDLSELQVTVVFAAYAVGTLTALLLGGGLSDRVGRRPVLALAVGTAVVSTLVFLLAPTLPGLLVARVLSGLSVGLTTGTATAAIAELHPDRRTATTLATVANMGGLGLGPVVSGVVAQHLPGPTVAPYLTFLVLLLPVLALGTVPETRPRAGGLAGAVRPQRLSVPRATRSRFAAAAVGGFAAFAVLGLFTSLTSSFLGQELGDPGPQLVGLSVAVMFAAAVGCQLLVQRWDPDRAALVGAGLLPTGTALVVVALAVGSLPLFLLAAVVGGAGVGFSFQSAVARVGGLASPDERAAVTSSFFVVAYLGITVPVVGVGEIATATSLTTAAVALAALVLVLSAGAAVLTRRHPTPTAAVS
ncbi:MFS transporter [Klenkia brasiliensis]|uniref:Predicted arabinose efflux permease, MFS family n=1 Tax=Klenkia brasiliensis TaxID=333142 RepID=A0A1G7XX84_9ACTN|nr:MFS transporter [Klenkia brasiliensis]SDG88812.1 Predicted arabinose efflux permease, MFS family [Klenkia brasiliensis]